MRDRLSRFADALRVRPSSQQDLPFIDGFRGLAIAMVLVVHTMPPTLTITWPLGLGAWHAGRYAWIGGHGVSLFFALSGFLLSQAWFAADYAHGPKPSVRRYFWRRFLRIAPAYYAFLIFAFIFFVPLLIDPNYLYSARGLKEIAAHALFVQKLGVNSQYSFSIAPQFWTLTHEACFYLLLPVFVFAFYRRRWLVTLPLLMLLGYFWRDAGQHSDFFGLIQWEADQSRLPEVAQRTAAARYLVTFALPDVLHFFAYGLVLGNLYACSRLPGRHWYATRWAASGYAIAGVGLLGFVLLDWSSAGHATELNKYGDLLIGPGLALLLASAVFGAPFVREAFSFLPLRLLGVISYSVYIWHFVFVLLVYRYAGVLAMEPTQRFLYLIVRMLPATILVGTLSYLWIERPFLMLARRRPTASPVAVVAPAPALTVVPLSRPAATAAVHFDRPDEERSAA
jgi:peptidoglycan/LPS O-acetylase OafA/YrhL